MGSPVTEERRVKPSEDSRTNDKPGLTGWAGIEDHLFTYDEGRTKGYAEDIDTLLVFAGLFSAILTAFVVQTYPQLQPDNSTTTNDLLAINNQLLIQGLVSHGTSFYIPPILNSTMSSILDAQPFTPPASARWINALFFTSLVLSLAAALFGILAKQWLREYMQWNSPLATPRENVIIRQFRFEAWESWNAAATIAAVPALLEIAMILFLVGMIILLWTLDDVVAMVLTVVVSLFLSVVSVFTVLPIFVRRCPYKSPTAWALVAASYGTQFMFSFIFRWLEGHAKLLRRRWTFLSSHFYLRGIRFWLPGSQSMVNRVKDLVTGDWEACLQRDCRSCEVIMPVALGTWRDVDMKYCTSKQSLLGSPGAQLANTAEASLSLRALWWVSRSSQDTRVVKYIRQCQQLPYHPRDVSMLLERSKHLMEETSTSRKGLYKLFADELDSILALGATDPSPVRLRTIHTALEVGRVIVRPDSATLGIAPGVITGLDCEALLNYIKNSTNAGDDSLSMSAVTFVQWLRSTHIRSAPPATVSSILEKMITAAEAISCQSRRYTHGCGDAEDAAWIYELWRERGLLSDSYGQLFRRLLHIFKTSYRRDVLVGDQGAIRLGLHECLEVAHRERTCEVKRCSWISHTCDGTWRSNYRECPLLAKGEGNIAGQSIARVTSAVLALQRDGSSELNFGHALNSAVSHERPHDATPSRNVDVAIIEPSATSCSTEDGNTSFSQPMMSSDTHNASTSVRSPGTASDTTAAFRAPRSTTPHPARVADAVPHALPIGYANSMATSIPSSSDRPPAADEVVPSDSCVSEGPSHDLSESRVEDQGGSCGDVADPGAEANAVLPAADVLPVRQHETAPFAATATETGGAEGPGAARGTSNQVDTPEAVVSYPTISTPLPVSNQPRATSTLDSQPPALLGGPLLDLTGPSASAEVRSPTITTVSRGRPESESSQGSLTSRIVAVDEPSREGQLEVQDAGRPREESSGRPASSLFLGVRAVSRRGYEEFELAVRDRCTGEDSSQDVQVRVESG